MIGEFEFDLTPTEIPVTISGQKYVLCEATDAVAAAFRNAGAAGATLDEDGNTHVGAVGDVQAVLVAGCLFRIVEKDDGTEWKRHPVPLAAVRGWPNRVVQPLFEKAKEISELGEWESAEMLRQLIKRAQRRLVQLERQAKNPPEEPTVGSE